MLEAWEQCGYAVRQFRMGAAERIVVGLGAESVLEASIRLHRVYGFPIIPGSALKGLARSSALWQVAEQLGVPALSLEERSARDKAGARTPLQKLEAYLDESADNRRAQLLDELRRDKAMLPSSPLHQLNLAAVEETTKPLRLAFGTMGDAGKVIFFDAVPADAARLKLDLDVMNPHYSQYYQGSAPPADYLNPVPVMFLTIAPGSEFRFAVASKEATLAQQAQRWLQAGLGEMGVGAKTVAGYGLWR
jgi:CRISPR-associated protein Cmr6